MAPSARIDSVESELTTSPQPGKHRRQLSRRATIFIFTALILIYAAQLSYHVFRTSATFDEPIHILAGYRYWECGDYGINPEHPPLLKLIASIPARFQQVESTPASCGSQLTPKWEGFKKGGQFLSTNGVERILVPARLAAASMSLILAVLVFLMAREMFGDVEALVASALLAFEPNLIAHGSLVTTDMALTTTTVGAVYALYRYLSQPGLARLLLTGVAVGLMLASKHSAILMLPILFLLLIGDSLLARWTRAKSDVTHRQNLYHFAAYVAVVLIGFVVLWAFYRFRYAALPGSVNNSVTLSTGGLLELILRSRIFPESYGYGLADVVLGGRRSTFLLGHVYSTGQWFYFPVAFTIKTSIALLLLIPFALNRKLYRNHARSMLFLLLPVVIYFGISMMSGLNIGVRHILPVYPSLMIVAAAGACASVRRNRIFLIPLIALLIFHIAASWRTAPNYIAFANDFWGGTNNTWRLLHESNVDWGQNLAAVEMYSKGESTGDCWLAYFGSGELAYLNQRCRLMPALGWTLTDRISEPVPPIVEGTIFLSPSVLPPLDTRYEAVAQTSPQAIIGGSILVYRGRFEFPQAAAESHIVRSGQLVNLRRFDEAMSDARKAVELAPNDPSAHLSLGIALARSHQNDEARRELRAAIRLANQHPGRFHHIERQAREELDLLG